MIAVDTSALMAIVLGEPGGSACIATLEIEPEILISAGTVAEALIVSARRNVKEEVRQIIEGLGFEVITVSFASARRVAQAYEQWGKGVNAAGLNFGDCFAYEVAKAHDCPLLYVGTGFARTDIKSAL